MNNNESLEWEEVRSEHILQDKWVDFRRSAWRLPDGSVLEPFYSYSRRDYVVIVASDTEGNYICVRQFRHGIRQVTTEFPAGGIERSDGREYRGPQDDDFVNPGRMNNDEKGFAAENECLCAQGLASEDACTFMQDPASEDACTYMQDSASEDALEAAKRELLEETGYMSDEWRHLLTVPSNATISDNYAHLFEARNCRQVADQNLDGAEFLSVIKISAGKIQELIDSGQFQQAMHICAWLLSVNS